MTDNERAAVTPAADLAARWQPSAEQMAVAEAILRGTAADKVYVGLALPGKTYGLWCLGQRVEPAPGFWPAHAAHNSARIARDCADHAAGAHLRGRPGTSAYASIRLSNGEPVFAVYEGIYGDDPDGGPETDRNTDPYAIGSRNPMPTD
jgi:hypothetical protein